MSKHQKYRHRKRMQSVDEVIKTLYQGLKQTGQSNPKIERFYFNYPKESQMDPFDKYFVYNKYSKGYRKGVHKVPKFTKLSLRENPKYF